MVHCVYALCMLTYMRIIYQSQRNRSWPKSTQCI